MNKPYNYGEIQEITLQWQKVGQGEDMGLPGPKWLSETKAVAAAAAAAAETS